MNMKESNKQFDDVKASLHTEALKLADTLEKPVPVPNQPEMIYIDGHRMYGAQMIRRLVEELDKQVKPIGVYDGKNVHIYTPQTKPLSDEEILNIWLPFATDGIKGKIEFARSIEERHGIS